MDKRDNLEASDNKTLGQIIYDAMNSYGYTEKEVRKQGDILEDSLDDIFEDRLYPNSIPLMCLKRILEFLKIDYNTTLIGIKNTFNLLEQKKSKGEYVSHPAAYLWENLESLGKYTTRLKELLNSDKNDERFVTQQAMPQGEEAGIKNSPSWKEIVEDWSKYYCSILKDEEAPWTKIAIEDTANLAKDYYEKEVVEPLGEELEKYKKIAGGVQEFFIPYPKGDYEHQNAEMDKLEITNDCFFQQRVNTAIFLLQRATEENERLKEALKQIEQFSDCGDYAHGIVKLKLIATEALKLK